MSVVLYVVGALAVMAGTAMIGFGVPVKEFSVGSTLIIAGMTAFAGGLVVIALAAVVAQLHRLSDLLTARPPARSARPLEPFERVPAETAAETTGVARIPFPPKPKAHNEPRDQQPAFAEPRITPSHEPAVDGRAAPGLAPTLRNPALDAFPAPRLDDAAAAPVPPPLEVAKTIPAPPLAGNGAGSELQRTPSALDSAWKPAAATIRPPQPSYFDSMWPADNAPGKKLNGDAARYAETVHREPPGASEPARNAELGAAPARPRDGAQPAAASEGRAAVAILKSGVVDGMGYTLYVDGSIEAELPQGTLRFASINELREHLEKNP